MSEPTGKTNREIRGNGTDGYQDSRGFLPVKKYDMYCPAIGKHSHKLNYFETSCAARNGKCGKVKCERLSK